MQDIKRNQSGFTLVEIAIVLVIIGLLLGGVLKGQELINNARIKNIVNDMNGVSAAYNTYIDRYRAMPGDELTATYTARGWGAGAIPSGNGNGAIEVLVGVTFNNPATNEGAGFWQTLRAAQMIGGNLTSVALPTNAVGGLIGVNGAVTYGQTGPTVCVSSITTKLALGVDTTIDGVLLSTNIGANSGVLRGATSAVVPLAPVAGVPAATAYNDTATVTPWTLCRPL